MAEWLWDPYLEDGRYHNPILCADYSDPDVVRVGRDYYMTASSFSNVPGLPILHSRDLVGWRVIGYALGRIPYPDYDTPAHGRGVWAPSIRHHQGRFWIFYAMPDEGIFFTTAENPAGQWSSPVLVAQAKGWIDPCPFWDDDGRAYLVHAFAKSRSGVKSMLRLCEMAPDGSALLDEGKLIFDGHDTQPTIEGPKLYKRNGWYYIFAPAGGVESGWQTALRAHDILGPYEEKIVMMQGAGGVNGPHQGGWVDTPSGQDWFVHFQDAGYAGRVTHLQPMRWVNDWPVIGDDPDDEGWGTPVREWTRPDTDIPAAPGGPAASDDFVSSALGPQWQWNANPHSDWYALAEGGLRLFAQPVTPRLCDAPNLLLQKFPRPDFMAEAALDLAALAEGDSCGLVMLSRSYGALVATRTTAGARLALVMGRMGAQEETTALPDEIEGTALRLQLMVDCAGRCTFSYGAGAGPLRTAKGALTAEKGVWVGAKLGLQCAGSLGGQSSVLVRTFTVALPDSGQAHAF